MELNLTIENRIEELRRLAALVEEFGAGENWPPDLVFQVNLVLEEVAINVIHYGHDGGLHEIEIALTSELDALTIEVIDDGRAFDPTKDATVPDVTLPMEERSVGGLGVYLVRTMMDEMRYRREGGRNHLTLVKYRAE
jgi:anti-sigma regulatory factor (Ser/Thr protein kinase)